MQRRFFMRSFALIGMRTMLPYSGINHFSANGNSNPNQPGDSSPQLIFFKNEDNEFKFLNVLGKAHYKFADIGELLAIRDAIDETDPSSFVIEYVKLADACKATADDCISKGLLTSARDAYLRASNYYYAATEYLDAASQAEKFPALFKIHQECWKAAAKLMDFNYEEFNIPYEGTSLSGFLMSHKKDKSATPFVYF